MKVRNKPHDMKAKAQVEDMVAAALGGGSLRDDILGNFQGEYVSFSLPGQGFPGTPESVSRFGLKDPEAFVSSVSSLLAFLGDQAGMPLKLKASEHESATVTVTSAPSTLPLATRG